MAQPIFRPGSVGAKQGPSNAAASASSGAPASPSISPSSTGIFRQLYNSVPHSVEIYLDNSGSFSGTSRSPINPAAIIALQVTDNMTDWVVSGTLTFLYMPEGTASGASSSSGQPTDTKVAGAEQNGKTMGSYQFRGDGFDLLRLVIKPEEKTGNTGLPTDIKISKDPKWILSYLFSITEIEDIDDLKELKGSMGAYMKCAKLYFHDVRYQIITNSNIEYSTALSPNADFSGTLANPGVLSTGEALLEVFNKALTNPTAGGDPAYTINANLGSQEQQPNADANASKWDKGAAKIFYTSPAQYSAEEDIEYIMANHVSEKPLKGGEASEQGDGATGAGGSGLEAKDICVLHTERPSDSTLLEKICLTPISDFFEKAGKEKDAPGPLQYEHFFVTGDNDGAAAGVTFHNAPINSNPNSDVDIKTAKFGQIASYSFIDMSPVVNSKVFRTTPVYSVDLKNRKFNVEFAGNDVASARKYFSGTYIDSLYKIEGTGEQLFPTQLHKSKQSDNIFPTFSLNGDNKLLRQRNGLHNLLYTGLFQSVCIRFKTLGLTLRESGTFIAIDATAGSSASDYNNKLFGQWFVVKVDHIFEAGIYTNIIYAVKIHNVRPKKTAFPDTL